MLESVGCSVTAVGDEVCLGVGATLADGVAVVPVVPVGVSVFDIVGWLVIGAVGLSEDDGAVDGDREGETEGALDGTTDIDGIKLWLGCELIVGPGDPGTVGPPVTMTDAVGPAVVVVGTFVVEGDGAVVPGAVGGETPTGAEGATTAVGAEVALVVGASVDTVGCCDVEGCSVSGDVGPSVDAVVVGDTVAAAVGDVVATVEGDDVAVAVGCSVSAVGPPVDADVVGLSVVAVVVGEDVTGEKVGSLVFFVKISGD